MNAIVFDTETNGKPLNYRASYKDINNWPRITQMAWQMIDIDSGKVLNSFTSLVIPDGWTVPTEKFFIDNNMSTERCQAEGKPIAFVLQNLIDDMNESEVLVAHNMDFDFNVVAAEMIRLQVRANRLLQKICTMEASTNYCQLPGAYGKYKWPQLLELHQKLFNEDFDGAHDALADVSACAKCFIELLKRGIISLMLL